MNFRPLSCLSRASYRRNFHLLANQMSVNVFRICDQSSSAISNAVEKAAILLMKGHVIAVPTDTLYGLAALAQNSSAVRQLYAIKTRDAAKPIAICVSSLSDLYEYSYVTVPNALLAELLPGPVTLIFRRKPSLNPELNPDTSLVGIRIPRAPFVCQLAQVCNGPLALTSANLSGNPSTLAVNEFKTLWHQLAAVFDSGPICDSTPEARLGSTIVDLSQPGLYRVVRPGCAYEATIRVLQNYSLTESP